MPATQAAFANLPALLYRLMPFTMFAFLYAEEGTITPPGHMQNVYTGKVPFPFDVRRYSAALTPGRLFCPHWALFISSWGCSTLHPMAKLFERNFTPLFISILYVS